MTSNGLSVSNDAATLNQAKSAIHTSKKNKKKKDKNKDQGKKGNKDGHKDKDKDKLKDGEGGQTQKVKQKKDKKSEKESKEDKKLGKTGSGDVVAGRKRSHAGDDVPGCNNESPDPEHTQPAGSRPSKRSKHAHTDETTTADHTQDEIGSKIPESSEKSQNESSPSSAPASKSSTTGTNAQSSKKPRKPSSLSSNLIRYQVPFADPIATAEEAEKIYAAVHTAARNRALLTGIKESQKVLRRLGARGTNASANDSVNANAKTNSSTNKPSKQTGDLTTNSRSGTGTGVVVLAADTYPWDIISHMAILCEEALVPYIYVPSRHQLGKASGSARIQTSAMMILPQKGKQPTKSSLPSSSVQSNASAKSKSKSKKSDSDRDPTTTMTTTTNTTHTTDRLVIQIMTDHEYEKFFKSINKLVQAAQSRIHSYTSIQS